MFAPVLFTWTENRHEPSTAGRVIDTVSFSTIIVLRNRPVDRHFPIEGRCPVIPNMASRYLARPAPGGVRKRGNRSPEGTGQVLTSKRFTTGEESRWTASFGKSETGHTLLRGWTERNRRRKTERERESERREGGSARERKRERESEWKGTSDNPRAHTCREITHVHAHTLIHTVNTRERKKYYIHSILRSLPRAF